MIILIMNIKTICLTHMTWTLHNFGGKVREKWGMLETEIQESFL